MDYLDGNQKATKDIEMSSSDIVEAKLPAQEHSKILNNFGSKNILNSIPAIRMVPHTKSDESI